MNDVKPVTFFGYADIDGITDKIRPLAGWRYNVCTKLDSKRCARGGMSDGYVTFEALENAIDVKFQRGCVRVGSVTHDDAAIKYIIGLPVIRRIGCVAKKLGTAAVY